MTEIEKLMQLHTQLRDLEDDYKYHDKGGGLFDIRAKIIRNAITVTEIAMSVHGKATEND